MQFPYAVLVIFDEKASKQNPNWKTKYFYFGSKLEVKQFKQNISTVASYLGIKEIKEVEAI